MIKPRVVLGGLVSEAWARSVGSYSRSLEYYNVRVKDGSQPSIPFINVFDVDKNTVLLCAMNSLYLIITFGIFWYMKRRQKGFQLRWLLVTYDALNVVIAAYIAISTLKYKLGHGGLLLCNPIATDAEGYSIANVFVLFYFQKYFEFFDTWFFLLRKSSRQVTFLHLFHHSSITVVVGSILPFDYNGDMYLPIMLNSANHMLVYLHYLLATLGLKSWWASSITSMQLSQFCIIFAQSLLSYRVGPTCGSPDFAKVLMILYMGSMVGLFGNFFLQRYILRRPYAGLDMCGVIKSPVAGTVAATQLCGVAKLNAHGCCVILLPPEFPDPDSARMTSSLNGIGNNSGSPTSKMQTPFTISYNLTPLGSPMPQLFISTELTRFSTSVWKSMGANSHAKAVSCSSSSDKEKKGATDIQNTSSACVGFCDKNVEKKTSDKNKTKSNITTKRKKGTPQFISENTENIIDIELEREQELERIILRNYWATIIKSKNSTSASGKMPRSVSTGNIPALYSSPLKYAKSTGNFFNLHNDRLIDGPLPLLRRLGGISSTDICQLDRDESDHTDYNGNYDNDDDGCYDNEKLIYEKKEGGKKLENSSAISNNSQSRATTTNPKSIQKSNQRNTSQHSDVRKFPLGIIPLCFTISGGVPSGRVSWMITSLPQENSNSCVLSEKDESENVCSDGDVYDSYSETGFPVPGSAGISADWRAL